MTNQIQNNFIEKPPIRMRNFHFRYLELCRSKNYAPVAEVKSKNKNTSILDFFGDRIHIDDWLLIIESLHYDEALQNISLRLRKNLGYVLENLDTIKKARMLKKQPVIFTKFVFCNLINAISNGIRYNRNLNTLRLEGLPLDSITIMTVAKALSQNENIKILSFNRSSIGDQGCDIICKIIKCWQNVESIGMSQCQLTETGASYIADLIKFQKISRYSESWQNALRYNNVNPESMAGLRSIFISQNNIGDNGTQFITEILKDDVWIKEIDLSECGITDVGAKYIINCLEMNKYLIDLRVKKNNEISSPFLRAINEQLGKDENRDKDNPKKNKLNIPKIKERIEMLEEQIILEKNLRKQDENLTEQLYAKIMDYDRKLIEEPQVPEGYTLIKTEELETIIKERDEYKNSLVAVKLKNSRSGKKIRKARSETKYKENIRHHKFNKLNSEHVFDNNTNIRQLPALYNNLISSYVEKGIGDSATATQLQQQQEHQSLQQQQLKPNFFKKINNDKVGDNYSDFNEYYSTDSYNSKNIEMCTKKKLSIFGGIEEAKKLFIQKKSSYN